MRRDRRWFLLLLAMLVVVGGPFAVKIASATWDVPFTSLESVPERQNWQPASEWIVFRDEGPHLDIVYLDAAGNLIGTGGDSGLACGVALRTDAEWQACCDPRFPVLPVDFAHHMLLVIHGPLEQVPAVTRVRKRGSELIVDVEMQPDRRPRLTSSLAPRNQCVVAVPRAQTVIFVDVARQVKAKWQVSLDKGEYVQCLKDLLGL